ncbi:nitroreductase [Streptomyces sp. NPDC056716]|uniref:nitroreductase n=1 Tax=Streptomyces sp. NPDC056716 TaxID=3345922 RepID=UPI0036B47662
MGCGAALLNLRAAAAAAGLAPAIRLLPDPARPPLLAEILTTGGGRPDPALALLAPAVVRRRSSRLPFEDRDIAEAVRQRLYEAVSAEGAQLLFPDAWHVREVLDLAGDAEDLEAHDPGLREETRRWARTEPTGRNGTASDGVPVEAFGPLPRAGVGPVRDFAAGRPVAGRGWAPFEANPRLALLGTAHDAPVDWLRAGQALERVWLRATTDGLVASVTSQPLEWTQSTRAPRSAVCRWRVPPTRCCSTRRPTRT